MTQEQIDAMVNKLAERMKANPDDPKGWLMLARSYKQMGRYAEAVDAFSHVEKIDEEPDLLPPMPKQSWPKARVSKERS